MSLEQVVEDQLNLEDVMGFLESVDEGSVADSVNVETPVQEMMECLEAACSPPLQVQPHARNGVK